MNAFRSFVREIHRRSLWQVVSIYLVGSWGALQVADQVTQSAGLPDWVPSVALLLLVIGLPIVAATAFVQEGMSAGEAGDAGPEEAGAPAADPPENLSPGTGSLDRPSTRPSRTSRLLTWRNAIGGGVLAAALLGVLVASYFIMRAAGIGPVASLAAQGLIDAGEPVILSEFSNSSNDASLGSVVTEALRVDLASSNALALVPPSRVSEVLERMQRDPSEALTADLANEVAVRDGIKAVIEGEVGSAGSGYILVATLRSSESGVALATFRRTAKGPDGVIDAIDGLSQDIREKAGESLKSIKAEPPLESVTTTSLDALRKYSQAEALADQGEYRRARTLLREAVDEDPDFAMAWRKLAVVIQSAGGEPGEEADAATRAYELRDHLTERERLQAIAYYNNVVTQDLQAQIEAYQALLEKWPDDASGLNNLAIAYGGGGRWEDALVLLKRAVSGPGESSPAWTNLVATYVSLGDLDAARVAQDSMEARYPKRTGWNLYDRYGIEAAAGNFAEAHRLGEEMVQLPDVPAAWHSGGSSMMAWVDAAQGKLSEATEHLRGQRAADRADERFGDGLNRALDLADIQAIVLPDGAGAKRTLTEILDSGDLDKVPAKARPYQSLVHQLGALGMLDQARAQLADWDRIVSGGSAVSEARRYLDARALSDEGATADGLGRLRNELPCPGCYVWQLAVLEQKLGHLDDAAQLYETSVAREQVGRPFGILRVMAQERLGQVYEAMGDSVKAAEHYARFAEAWADADASLQPRVREARQKAESLGG
jgi:tetratricopeptide (TPR) repeat protein